jgi:hypothetical protein
MGSQVRVSKTQREETKVHENGFGYTNAASLMGHARPRSAMSEEDMKLIVWNSSK